MEITIKEIQSIFVKLINEKIDREEADRWAYKRWQLYHSNSLKFIPISKREVILNALDYLYGIDIQDNPNEYLHSLKEIKEIFKDKWENI